jgi:two-component system phosphate regulon sensor histidine kinase PhoR
MLASAVIIVLLLAALAVLGVRTLAYCQDARNQMTALQVQLARLQKDSRLQQVLSRTLFDVAYDALLVVDQSHTILACNRHVAKLCDLQDPVGKSLANVTNMPDLDAIVGNVLLHETTVLEEQITVGETHYNVKARVIRDGERVFVGLALRDITRLVRLNRARRDMVANISHELRTPIANIRLTIDGLFHESEKPRRKDSISSLHQIARETENLLWLVQEMSDLSMIESGQAIVRLVEAPLHEVVDEAIEHLEDQSDSLKVSIKSKVDEDLRVLCDRDLVRRVLVNLIHNALKWSPKKDTVTVQASDKGREVVVSVLDNGPGVPQDQVDRIFERFYQTDASRSGSQGGTGLGLAICRHVVEAHGGRIWAEGNQETEGGKFNFTLLNAMEYQQERSEDDQEPVEA